MKNKNVPVPEETKALEVYTVLGELEDRLEVLGQKIDTLEDRLKNVSRPYNDDAPDVPASAPLYSANLSIRIDRSVTNVGNAIDRIKTILIF